MTTRARRAPTFLSADFIARVRGALLPKDRDRELCPQTCAEPSFCTGASCWATRLIQKQQAAKPRDVLAPRRVFDVGRVYLARGAKRRSAS
jgi:hypothetical protein